MAARLSLEYLLKEVPPEKLDQPCRYDHLSKMALSLTDWQSISPFLGFTEADEEEIRRDYSSTRTQKIAMLRRWKKRYGRKAKYRKLLTVFWDLEQVDLVERGCELLQTANSSSNSDEETNRTTECASPPVPWKPGCKMVADEKGTSTGAKRHQNSTVDSYAEYLRGRYETERPMFFTLQWLRDPTIQSAVSLFDILPAESESTSRKVMSELQSCKGCDVLFVLDGWDEYGAGLRANSLFQQLICTPGRVNMHFSSLIITSRPIASGELQRYASSRVEIVGFTSAEVKKYFSESIGCDTVQKPHDHLRERPVIQASCYLPLNAAIVVHLFLALNYTLPHTLHEVFLSLVLCCIIRHLTKLAEEGKEILDISSLDDLPPDVLKTFNNICAMAYHGVMKNKATFSAADLQSFDLPTDVSTLSSRNFLHRSVQELLAAFHISKLPAVEQIQIFNDLFGRPQLVAVFRFYAAFTKLQTEGVRDIVARMMQEENKLGEGSLLGESKSLLLSLLHCLYEAQDLSLCKFVASSLNGELVLSKNTLSPMDCLVLGYFLSCVCLSISREFNVYFRWCSLDEYRVSFLVRELSKCSNSPKSLLTLDLNNNNLSDGGVIHIADILRQSNCLKTLDIYDCSVGDQGMKSLASSLVLNSSLEELSLSGNDVVTGVGLMALGQSLKRNRGLKRLWLYEFYNISNNDWTQFMVCLKENDHMTQLVLPPSSPIEVVQRETKSVNHIRRKNNLPLLEVHVVIY